MITEHNYIAEQDGLGYTFFVPRFLQNSSDILEFPMLFVAFQGWPLVENGSVVYENCVDAGVYLKETTYYVVDLPRDLAKTIAYYHKADCPRVPEWLKQTPEFVVTKEEAVREYGAFPCDFCLP